ncbi:MAG: polysaccharide deacetylase [Lachnospiraceae bacterium]|nr:polysaccharide deacetylase [Lachnospiraceae bacterium]
MEKENNKNDRAGRIITAATLLMSACSMILAAILFVRLNDLEERLKSVSFNSYVEQTVVSNNYIVTGEDDPGQVTVSFSDDSVKKAYLTFDDGPSVNTGKILDILKQYNVKATFFVCGTVDGNENLRNLYKRIVDEGHTIAMHSYSHRYGTLYASAKSFEDDLDKIHSLIYNETGVDARLYRFPGGSGNTVSKHDMNDFIRILHDRGYEYQDWNVYPGNSEGTSIPADRIVSGILEKVRDNDSSIILLHDTGAKNTTVEALPQVIEGLQKMDIRLLPMSENTPLVQQISGQ